MGRSRFAGWMAGARGWAHRVHAGRVSSQQRIHLAALLIVFAAVPAFADDISFDPATTDAEFAKFSRLAAQAIFPTPVQPARSTGLLGFDIGIAATAVPVDRNSAYWQHAVTNDFTTHGYVGVPRLVASKGLGVATVSGSYAKVSSSGIKTYGGTLDVPLLRGSLAMPEIALRGSYATVTGATDFRAKVYGLEAFISKGFGPVTPYGAIGRMRTDTSGTIHLSPTLPDHRLAFKGDINRYTAGVRFSLLAPKIAIEVTKAEVTSYAAKVSFGF